MKNLKKQLIAISVCFTLMLPLPSRADFWGGDGVSRRTQV